MEQQSNQPNLDEMSATDLAAYLGQLPIAECEPHRDEMIDRLRSAGHDVDATTPTVVLLRLLGTLPTPNHRPGGPASGNRDEPELDLAFAR